MKKSSNPPPLPTGNDLLTRASNVDEAINRETRQSELDQAMQPDAPQAEPGPAAAAVPIEETTSALKDTFVVLLALTVERLHSTWHWSDPGQQWREEVGNKLGLLADRYIGELALKHSLELSLIFLIAPWVIENAITNGFPAAKKSKNTKAADAQPEVVSSARGDGVREVNPGEAAA